jgi:hypothetical protein
LLSGLSQVQEARGVFTFAGDLDRVFFDLAWAGWLRPPARISGRIVSAGKRLERRGSGAQTKLGAEKSSYHGWDRMGPDGHGFSDNAVYPLDMFRILDQL